MDTKPVAQMGRAALPLWLETNKERKNHAHCIPATGPRSQCHKIKRDTNIRLLVAVGTGVTGTSCPIRFTRRGENANFLAPALRMKLQGQGSSRAAFFFFFSPFLFFREKLAL